MTTIPDPGLYRVKPFEVEALQWLPGRAPHDAAMIGWLIASGVDFHHPGPGTGYKTKLAVGEGADTMTARPGDWVVREGDIFLVVSAVMFETMFEDQGTTKRQRADTERRRRARIIASEEYPSWCIAHRRRVQWEPSPTWWYHADGAIQIPENHQCRPLLGAHPPQGVSDE